jgi:hypothetical protein
LDTGEIEIYRDGKAIAHRAGASFFTVDGEEIGLDVPSVAVWDYVYVPMGRMLASLGFGLSWEGETRTVAVTAP